MSICVAAATGRAAGWQTRLAHLLLVDNPPHNPAGDFGLLDNGLLAAAGCRLTFSGIAAYHPALFAATRPPDSGQAGTAAACRHGAGQVSGSRLDGLWLDVGTPERLAEADAIAAGWSA
jgi:MurNAc alpha-1-phosphate uridylyltransferase